MLRDYFVKAAYIRYIKVILHDAGTGEFGVLVIIESSFRIYNEETLDTSATLLIYVGDISCLGYRLFEYMRIY